MSKQNEIIEDSIEQSSSNESEVAPVEQPLSDRITVVMHSLAGEENKKIITRAVHSL